MHSNMTNEAATPTPCNGIKHTMNIDQVSPQSIASAYCFFHQKWQVYAFSHSERQRDDIEYAISGYVNEMDPQLYEALARGREGFLLTHASFAADMQEAIATLDTHLQP